MKPLRIADFGLRIGSTAMLAVALALGLLAAPIPSQAQQPAKVYRIGYLTVSTGAYDHDAKNCPISGTPNWQAFMEGLRERGYIPGQNLIIECRYTEGREERAPALVAELVSLKPDLMVVAFAANVRAAKQATSTIPIVMVNVMDPVGRGLVATLPRPGGNVTGLTDTVGVQIAGKRLQLVKEAVPTVSLVALFDYTGDPLTPPSGYRKETEAAARAFGVTLLPFAVHDHKEFEIVFTAMTKARAGALIVGPHPFINIHRKRIVDLAAQNRLPAVYPYREAAEAGGLMSYGVSTPDIYRRLGFYVDKIFHGAKPGDLPVEQPTKFELIINLKAAKALGLTIPQSLLSRADEVIQ